MTSTRFSIYGVVLCLVLGASGCSGDEAGNDAPERSQAKGDGFSIGKVNEDDPASVYDWAQATCATTTGKVLVSEYGLHPKSLKPDVNRLVQFFPAGTRTAAREGCLRGLANRPGD